MSDRTIVEIPPQSGTAFELRKGQKLRIIDMHGSQVADLAAYSLADVREQFSPGRSIDYAERIALSTGAILFSNRSNPMLEIISDDVESHDCLLSPCSQRMFERRGEYGHPSCHENLCRTLAPYGIEPDAVVSTFNVFMNVSVSPQGRVAIGKPLSNAGDTIVFEARMDLIVGLTACSSELTNGGQCRSIGYCIQPAEYS